MGLREQKKERQRREILAVAIAMFRERGYDQTRVQDIIARLLVSEATFFNYFATKDELLHEFVLGEIDRQAAMLRRELGDSRGSVRDRIRKIAGRIAAAWSADREFMAIAITRSNLMRASGELKEKELRNYALLADLFAEGQRRGEFRSDLDPRQLAEMLTAIYMLTGGNWVTRWWGGREEKLETRMLRAVDLFLDGCAAGAQAKSSKNARGGPKPAAARAVSSKVRQ